MEGPKGFARFILKSGRPVKVNRLVRQSQFRVSEKALEAQFDVGFGTFSETDSASHIGIGIPQVNSSCSGEQTCRTGSVF
jgi:hypothetical protein